MFRLGRFFDEIKGLTKILKTDKPVPFIVLSVFTYLCSAMYYVTDNALWLVGILIRSQAIDKAAKKGLKYYKNSFSLSRIIAYLIILVFSVFLQEK